MIPTRAPLITTGQVYLHEELNEYMIVTGNQRGQIQYSGIGFKGCSEDQSFVERFKPVDPRDVEPIELSGLVELCARGTTASTGFIQEG